MKTYRLRTLFLVVSVLAVGLAYWRLSTAPYRAQRRAAQRLEKTGAELIWDADREQVISVDLKGVRITSRDLQALGYLPWLCYLNLRASFDTTGTSAAITDDDLRHLANLQQLGTLDLGHLPITGRALEHLRGLKQLQLLNLEGIDLGDAALQRLQTLDRLQELNLTGVTDAGLEHLSKFPQLVSLTLSGTAFLRADQTLQTEITDGGLAALAGCARLRVLDLSQQRGVTSAGLQHLAGCPGLVALDLRGTRFDASGVEHLAALHRLRDLRLPDVPLPPAAWQHLAGMNELQYLDAPLDASSPPPWEAWPKLNSVRLVHATDSSLARLADLRMLNQLEVFGPDLTDRGLQQLPALPELAKLHIASKQITSAGIAALTALPNLRHLRLEGLSITDDAVPHLLRCRTLQRLDVKDTAVTEAGVETLRQAGLRVRFAPAQDSMDWSF